MISDCPDKNNEDANAESHDEEQNYELLTPQMISSPTFQRQICHAIYTLIPEVPRLRNLFMNWESLPNEDKAIVDEYARTENSGMELYKPLVEALKQWDKVQDTQGTAHDFANTVDLGLNMTGAPGCEPGVVSLSGHPQIEAALLNVVHTLECLVGRLLDDTCSEHLGSGTASGLTSSLRSVYDEDRDRGDSASEYGSGLRRSLSLDDIPKLVAGKSLLSL